MSTVIDASALIAFLRDETGADVVENVLSAPGKCYAHAMNLCEVYYDFFRSSNRDAAEAAIHGRLRDLQYDSDHHEERQGIEDAKSTLAFLRRETTRLYAEDSTHVAPGPPPLTKTGHYTF